MARTLLFQRERFYIAQVSGIATLTKETIGDIFVELYFESTQPRRVDIILDPTEFVNVDALTRSATFKVLAEAVGCLTGLDKANQAPTLALIKGSGDAKNPLAYVQEGNKDSLR